MFINYHQSDWADWLATAEFSYNDWKQTSTDLSPFYIKHGRHPYKGTEPDFTNVRNETAAEFTKRMTEIHHETESALRLSAETMKKYYDRRRQPSIKYKKGDKVYLEGLNLMMTRPMTKLSDKRYGPFTIEKQVGAASYKLKLPARWKCVHPVFNEHLLTPHRPPSFPSQKAREPDLPPDIEDPDAEYDVESILEAGIDEPTQRLKYLVKWDGFGPEENSWEYAEDLVRCSDKIRDFYRHNPGAPRPIAALAKKLRLRPLINFMEVPAVKHRLEW